MCRCGSWGTETSVWELICVALNLLTVKSERSNNTQVLREFCVPKNSFHMLPKVLKADFKNLEIRFHVEFPFLFEITYGI